MPVSKPSGRQKPGSIQAAAGTPYGRATAYVPPSTRNLPVGRVRNEDVEDSSLFGSVRGALSSSVRSLLHLLKEPSPAQVDNDAVDTHWPAPPIDTGEPFASQVASHQPRRDPELKESSESDVLPLVEPAKSGQMDASLQKQKGPDVSETSTVEDVSMGSTTLNMGTGPGTLNSAALISIYRRALEERMRKIELEQSTRRRSETAATNMPHQVLTGIGEPHSIRSHSPPVGEDFRPRKLRRIGSRTTDSDASSLSRRRQAQRPIKMQSMVQLPPASIHPRILLVSKPLPKINLKASGTFSALLSDDENSETEEVPEAMKPPAILPQRRPPAESLMPSSDSRITEKPVFKIPDAVPSLSNQTEVPSLFSDKKAAKPANLTLQSGGAAAATSTPSPIDAADLFTGRVKSTETGEDSTTQSGLKNAGFSFVAPSIQPVQVGLSANAESGNQGKFEFKLPETGSSKMKPSLFSNSNLSQPEKQLTSDVRTLAQTESAAPKSTFAPASEGMGQKAPEADSPAAPSGNVGSSLAGNVNKVGTSVTNNGERAEVSPAPFKFGASTSGSVAASQNEAAKPVFAFSAPESTQNNSKPALAFSTETIRPSNAASSTPRFGGPAPGSDSSSGVPAEQKQSNSGPTSTGTTAPLSSLGQLSGVSSAGAVGGGLTFGSNTAPSAESKATLNATGPFNSFGLAQTTATNVAQPQVEESRGAGDSDQFMPNAKRKSTEDDAPTKSMFTFGANPGGLLGSNTTTGTTNFGAPNVSSIPSLNGTGPFGSTGSGAFGTSSTLSNGNGPAGHGGSSSTASVNFNFSQNLHRSNTQTAPFQSNQDVPGTSGPAAPAPAPSSGFVFGANGGTNLFGANGASGFGQNTSANPSVSANALPLGPNAPGPVNGFGGGSNMFTAGTSSTSTRKLAQPKYRRSAARR